MTWTTTPAWQSTGAACQSARPASLWSRSDQAEPSQDDEMVKFQVTNWSEILEEIIIILTILGAAIAFVFSLLIMKILATR